MTVFPYFLFFTFLSFQTAETPSFPPEIVIVSAFEDFFGNPPKFDDESARNNYIVTIKVPRLWVRLRIFRRSFITVSPTESNFFDLLQETEVTDFSKDSIVLCNF